MQCILQTSTDVEWRWRGSNSQGQETARQFPKLLPLPFWLHRQERAGEGTRTPKTKDGKPWLSPESPAYFSRDAASTASRLLFFQKTIGWSSIFSFSRPPSLASRFKVLPIIVKNALAFDSNPPSRSARATSEILNFLPGFAFRKAMTACVGPRQTYGPDGLGPLSAVGGESNTITRRIASKSRSMRSFSRRSFCSQSFRFLLPIS